MQSDFAAGYSAIRPKYDHFCADSKRIIAESLENKRIDYHAIEARAKSETSFKEKASRKNPDGTSRYSDPIKEITDLAGVRIITYTIDDVEKVCKFIEENFTVIEKTDVGEKRFAEGKFGYQSVHFLVKYRDARANLPEFSPYKDMVCEIQVRTVLQHAWAEIEHDIQYKNGSELPSTLQRRFIALAGLLEIADREFQNIKKLDSSLKEEISASLQEDLTKVAIAELGQGREEGELEQEEISVRQLIRSGRFADAVKAYDKMLQDSPMMHTLFIGRAKARFLSGDRSGAVRDVQHSLDLNPGDRAALALKEQLEEGTLSTAVRAGDDASAPVANELTKRANEFIEAGDGASAFEYYSNAQEAGASRPFSLLNKAIACILAGDTDGAKIQLGYLELREGTPFAVCMVALYSIVYALSAPEKFDSEFDRLKSAKAACEDFLFDQSPLARMGRGLEKASLPIDQNAKKDIESVFLVLSGERNAQKEANAALGEKKETKKSSGKQPVRR